MFAVRLGVTPRFIQRVFVERLLSTGQARREGGRHHQTSTDLPAWAPPSFLSLSVSSSCPCPSMYRLSVRLPFGSQFRRTGQYQSCRSVCVCVYVCAHVHARAHVHAGESACFHKCCRERCLPFIYAELTDSWCPSVSTAFHSSGKLPCPTHTHTHTLMPRVCIANSRRAG